MEKAPYNKEKRVRQSPRELGTFALAQSVKSEKKYDLDWREVALCLQGDPEVFFPRKGITANEAKKHCAQCKVRDECLEAALAVDSSKDHGVWGGTTERERRKIRKARKLQEQSERAA